MKSRVFIAAILFQLIAGCTNCTLRTTYYSPKPMKENKILRIINIIRMNKVSKVLVVNDIPDKSSLKYYSHKLVKTIKKSKLIPSEQEKRISSITLSDARKIVNQGESQTTEGLLSLGNKLTNIGDFDGVIFISSKDNELTSIKVLVSGNFIFDETLKINKSIYFKSLDIDEFTPVKKRVKILKNKGKNVLVLINKTFNSGEKVVQSKWKDRIKKYYCKDEFKIINKVFSKNNYSYKGICDLGGKTYRKEKLAPGEFLKKQVIKTKSKYLIIGDISYNFIKKNICGTETKNPLYNKTLFNLIEWTLSFSLYLIDSGNNSVILKTEKFTGTLISTLKLNKVRLSTSLMEKLSKKLVEIIKNSKIE